jgi:deoxyribonuclease V
LKCHDEVIGAEVITKSQHKPVYGSTGHMVSLETAIEIVKHCTRSSRIPEPILKAHEIADKVKQKINLDLNTTRRSGGNNFASSKT